GRIADRPAATRPCLVPRKWLTSLGTRKNRGADRTAAISPPAQFVLLAGPGARYRRVTLPADPYLFPGSVPMKCLIPCLALLLVPAVASAQPAEKPPAVVALIEDDFD